MGRDFGFAFLTFGLFFNATQLLRQMACGFHFNTF